MVRESYITTLEVLARYEGRRVYLHEVSGNNGDELILKGSELLIEQAGCIPTADPAQADALLINGGFKSDFWPFANETIRDFSTRYPGTPLVILPSSFLFEATDFPSLFSGRTALVTIIAREQPSLEIVESMEFGVDVEFGLDHDTAFALARSPIVRRLAATAPTRDVLIVERGDAESPTGLTEQGIMQVGILRKVASAVLPKEVAMLAARMLNRSIGARGQDTVSPFAELAVELVADNVIEGPVDGVKIADISRRSVCSFEEFCEEIARSKVVVSTRLHVAILSAIMGRKTFIVAGKYHKIPGIYEYSMNDMDQVSMVDRECKVVG